MRVQGPIVLIKGITSYYVDGKVTNYAKDGKKISVYVINKFPLVIFNYSRYDILMSLFPKLLPNYSRNLGHICFIVFRVLNRFHILLELFVFFACLTRSMFSVCLDKQGIMKCQQGPMWVVLDRSLAVHAGWSEKWGWVGLNGLCTWIVLGWKQLSAMALQLWHVQHWLLQLVAQWGM